MKEPFLKIGTRVISKFHKPLIIPELGINHNGSLETAFKIVDAAHRAGAEIIKHQTHIPYDEMSEEAKKIKPGNSNKNIFDIINRCSLSEEQEYKLYKYVNKKKMIFLSTPFSKLAVDRLVKFGVKAFKIGSGEMNNYPLVEYICKFKKPMILSTGMHSIQNVKKVVKFLKNKQSKFAIMHTTNLYPTPDHLVRLDSIKELMSNFPKQVIGLSDHTASNHSSFVFHKTQSNIDRSIIHHHGVDQSTQYPSSIRIKNMESLLPGKLESIRLA